MANGRGGKNTMHENHPLIEARKYVYNVTYDACNVYKCHIGPESIVTESVILVIDLHETFSYTMLTSVPILYTADMITSERPLKMTIQHRGSVAHAS